MILLHHHRQINIARLKVLRPNLLLYLQLADCPAKRLFWNNTNRGDEKTVRNLATFDGLSCLHLPRRCDTREIINCNVLYSTVQYYTVQYCTVMHCNVLYSNNVPDGWNVRDTPKLRTLVTFQYSFSLEALVFDRLYLL